MNKSGELTLEEHLRERSNAESSYAQGRDSETERALWVQYFNSARSEVDEALKASDNLKNISGALTVSGFHSRALRTLLAPPLSQDQFKIVCPLWPKSSEKNGKPISAEAAAAYSQVFQARSDPTRSSNLGDPPKRVQSIEATAILIANTEYGTARRMILANAQQESVVSLLESRGYKKVSLGTVDEPGVLPEKCFAVATQFRTADGSSHEVDIAVGLRKKVILAIECKVSNDKTNSVKRVNDILKKATAWKRQWGQFVVTGALLQGVFSDKEPRRLMDNDVELFWSHRVDLINEWLDQYE